MMSPIAIILASLSAVAVLALIVAAIDNKRRQQKIADAQ
jgi:hypothetical protein